MTDLPDPEPHWPHWAARKGHEHAVPTDRRTLGRAREFSQYGEPKPKRSRLRRKKRK